MKPLIFINIGSIICSILLFLTRVVVSDLYLFQNVVSFQPLLQVFWKLDVIVYKQSDSLDLSIWSVAVNADVAATTVWAVCDILDYAISWPWKIKLYFTVNQRQIKKSPKITQIFE